MKTNWPIKKLGEVLRRILETLVRMFSGRRVPEKDKIPTPKIIPSATPPIEETTIEIKPVSEFSQKEEIVTKKDDTKTLHCRELINFVFEKKSQDLYPPFQRDVKQDR